MQKSTKLMAGLGSLALAGALVAFAPRAAETPDVADEAAADGDKWTWHVRATGARIVGGYGDNFAYDGNNVRPLEGKAEMKLNHETGRTSMVIKLRTTEESGPIHFSENKKFEGEIKLVQKLDTRKMKKARIATDLFLHGDTGNEAPVMPRIYNYFASWGPTKVFVNGREVIPMIGGHCMFSEQARNAAGEIVGPDGKPYNPMRRGERGFTDSDETEFHFVVHTNEPDKNNFPPHSGWMHLHFSDVEVVKKPADAEVPYEAD